MKKYLKRKSSADHGIQYDPTTPKVNFKPVIPFPSDHFRSSIAGTSTSSLQFFLNQRFFFSVDTTLFPFFIFINDQYIFRLSGLTIGVRQPKIYNFDVFISIQQHIFRLEIAMDNAQTMQIVYSIDDLMEEFTSLALVQSAQRNEYFFWSAM